MTKEFFQNDQYKTITNKCLDLILCNFTHLWAIRTADCKTLLPPDGGTTERLVRV